MDLTIIQCLPSTLLYPGGVHPSLRYFFILFNLPFDSYITYVVVFLMQYVLVELGRRKSRSQNIHVRHPLISSQEAGVPVLPTLSYAETTLISSHFPD